MEEIKKYSSFEELKEVSQNEKHPKEENKKEFEDFVNLLQKSKEDMKRKTDKRKR